MRGRCRFCSGGRVVVGGVGGVGGVGRGGGSRGGGSRGGDGGFVVSIVIVDANLSFWWHVETSSLSLAIRTNYFFSFDINNAVDDF